MSPKHSNGLAKKILIGWSSALSVVVVLLAAIGYYLSTGILLKLSLTDLLPEHHPSVVKFEKLTEVVGGVGYFAIVLRAEDKASHEKVANGLVKELRKSNLVTSAFYERERKFFATRLLYYGDLPRLQTLEKNVEEGIKRIKYSFLDLGLTKRSKSTVDLNHAFDEELKTLARNSAKVTDNLVSEDGKTFLVMVKPTFDSTDLGKTRELIELSTKLLAHIPSNVSYEFAERYYGKLLETQMIEGDIIFLGSLSLILIALVLFLYIRSIRGVLTIFIPVILGMGITFGITYLVIGHINIITGFLMGIVSGLGVDYGIHLVLRLRLERTEPSDSDPDPVWRSLKNSGHSVFVGATAAALAFFFLCFSTFRAFSEFGFICGVGIVAVLLCLLTTFSTLCRIFNLANEPIKESKRKAFSLPQLKTKKSFYTATIATFVVFGLGVFVQFEYEFDKMLQFSQKMRDSYKLVDTIFGRSAVPSAFAVKTKEDAIAIEKLVKEKYMPKFVNEIVSGATIIPGDQEKKFEILKNIGSQVGKLKDRMIERVLDVPASVVLSWVAAEPFAFTDLPSYTQTSLRGTQKSGYLIYVYPAVNLNNALAVRDYAGMLRDIESRFPDALIGSDAIIFSDILDLIAHDGFRILAVIFFAVLAFMWLNIRKLDDTILSYLPLIVALPVGMGLMWAMGIKFNIFNIAIIPTFVAMGIDVPIHVVHRTRETGSGLKAARDLASSINLALLTAAVGFGVLIFARAGVLRSLGAIALLGTVAIWWIGLVILPAALELLWAASEPESNAEEVVPT